MTAVRAAFHSALRPGEQVGPVVIVDRKLKSGKLDFYYLTPAEARKLAIELLVAATRGEGDIINA